MKGLGTKVQRGPKMSKVAAVMAVMVSFYVGHLTARWYIQNRADQGYVKVGEEVWKMKRLQTFGMGLEKIAVYEQAK